MAFRILPGSAAPGLSLVGAGLALAFPEQRWLGFLLIGAGLVLFMIDVRWESARWSSAAGSASDGEREPRRIPGMARITSFIREPNFAAALLAFFLCVSGAAFYVQFHFPQPRPYRVQIIAYGITAVGAALPIVAFILRKLRMRPRRRRRIGWIITIALWAITSGLIGALLHARHSL